MSAVLSLLVPPPSAADAVLAGDGARALAQIVARGGQEHLRIAVDGQELELPLGVFQALRNLLGQMALGHAVQITPHHAELTTQQAADFLNVSRPYLIRQLDAGALPFHRVGTHRRIFFADLLTYQESARVIQRAAAEDLLQLSQDEGLIAP
jgi:excisionase family DNA binding protein